VKIAIVRHRNRLEYTFDGNWDWNQFYNALPPDQLFRGDEAFDVIFDIRNVTQLPMDAVLHLKPAIQLAERHEGKYVIVATGSSAQTLFLSVVSIYSAIAARCFLVSSMEEADTLLSKPNNDESRTIYSA
jgi:hypothetical protein